MGVPDENGLYARYRGVPAELRPTHHPDEGPRFGWADILERWDLVLLDLHSLLGVDYDDPTLIRPWPWWRDRIRALVAMPGMLRAALLPDP